MIANNEIVFICVLLVVAIGFYVVSIFKRAGIPMVLSGIALLLLGSMILYVPEVQSYNSVDINNTETITNYSTATWESPLKIPLSIFFWLTGLYQIIMGALVLMSGKASGELEGDDFEGGEE